MGVPLEYRTDSRARRVTLCKRKKGLYKKAEELATAGGLDVAVIIVGDSCKPAQMIANKHGNFTDLPRAYNLLQRYSEKVQAGQVNQPTAADQVKETLKAQEQKLLEQRREIEQLKQEILERAGKPLDKDAIRAERRREDGIGSSHQGSLSQIVHDEFDDS